MDVITEWHEFSKDKPEENKTVVFLIKTEIRPSFDKDDPALYGYVHTTGSWNAKNGISVDAFRKHTPMDAVYLAKMEVLFWFDLIADPEDLIDLSGSTKLNRFEGLFKDIAVLKEKHQAELTFIADNCVHDRVKRLWNSWPCEKEILKSVVDSLIGNRDEV